METLKIEIPDGFKVESFDTTTGTVKFAPLPKDIRERIKSVADAILLLGYDDNDVVDYRKMQSLALQNHVLGNQELILVTKALNEGWIPDWHNGEYDKWINYFNMSGSSSASRFSFYCSDDWLSASIVGSRLCFKSKHLAQYAASQFLDIYQKTYII